MAIKILLVDDSETQLKFLKEELTANNFEVETALSGAEAYKKLFTFAPDIVVSDIVMPPIDGYQLCRLIKNDDETKINKKEIEELAKTKYGNLAGIAQQYLFYWRRGA